MTRTIWSLLSLKMREFWSSFTLQQLLETVAEAGGSPDLFLAKLGATTLDDETTGEPATADES